MALFLVIKLGDELTEHELKGSKLVIGRSKKADLTIGDSNLSSTHIEFEVIAGSSIKFTDLDSTNGTYLNGTERTSGSLYIGDVVQIGNTKIKLNKDKLTKSERIDFKNPKKSATQLINPKTVESKASDKTQGGSINFEVEIPTESEDMTASIASRESLNDSEISLETNSAVEHPKPNSSNEGGKKSTKQNTIIKKLQEEGYEESGHTKFIKLSDLKQNENNRAVEKPKKTDRVKQYNKDKKAKNKNVLERIIKVFKK